MGSVRKAATVMIIILMGVSGAGKTTIGQLLAHDLGWAFYDADDFHPQANIDKMRQGIALTDEDRAVWLATLHTRLQELAQEQRSVVLACSALKQVYRDQLQAGIAGVRFVYLKGSYELIRQRLWERQHQFMPSSLLCSQFVTLEEPPNVLTIDVTDTPGEIVATIKQMLGL